MEIVELPLDRLREAPWNPNQMDERTKAHLEESVRHYGLVENLVVRPLHDGAYEVLSGNQRLSILGAMELTHIPCVVVDLEDDHARLLAQALNHIRGHDDLGLRAELLRKVLRTVSAEDISALLPDTASSLVSLASMGKEDISAYLGRWQQAQAARLKHLQFQVTAKQLDVIEEALSRVMQLAIKTQSESPNLRGNALHILCKSFLERESCDGA